MTNHNLPYYFTNFILVKSTIKIIYEKGKNNY